MSLLSCAWASNAELRCIYSIQHSLWSYSRLHWVCISHKYGLRIYISMHIYTPRLQRWGIFRSFQLIDSNVSDSNSKLILVRKQKEFISSIRHCIISLRFASDMSSFFFALFKFDAVRLHGKEQIASTENLWNGKSIYLFISRIKLDNFSESLISSAQDVCVCRAQCIPTDKFAEIEFHTKCQPHNAQINSK